MSLSCGGQRIKTGWQCMHRRELQATVTVLNVYKHALSSWAHPGWLAASIVDVWTRAGWINTARRLATERQNHGDSNVPSTWRTKFSLGAAARGAASALKLVRSRLTSKQVAFVGISPADTNDTLTQSKDAALNAASTFNEQLPAPLPATSRRPRTLFAVVAKT